VTGMPDIRGVWRLRSYYLQNIQTGERVEPLGAEPNGVLILLPEGRMAALLMPMDPKPPTTDADQANVFRRMVAYSGLYRLEPPDRFVTMVDIAWFQSWVGSERARRFVLDGETLNIITDPTQGPWGGHDPVMMGVLSWVRERPAA
jgi:hypothetical protein